MATRHLARLLPRRQIGRSAQTLGSCPLRCLDSGCRVHRMYTLKPLTLNPDLYGIPSVETDPSRGAVCACAPASFPGRIQPAMLGQIVADLRLERDSAGHQSMRYGWCSMSDWTLFRIVSARF